MSWWQIAVLVCGGIVIVSVGFVGMLTAMWHRQERRDGLR